MKIHDAEFVVFDVETTGLSVQDGDRIIEIAAMKVKRGVIVGEFHSLINPKRSLPVEATLVNQITQEMVEKAPFSDVVLPQMMDFVGGACLTAHNAKFDLNFLAYELAVMGRKIKDETPAIDTLKMSRELLPFLNSHKLSLVARSLGIAVGETHRALSDVKLTVDVFLKLLDMAREQRIDEIGVFLNQFGVEKPSFKINQVTQGSLF